MRAETILSFWFGDLADDHTFPTTKEAIWWGKGYDAEILERFGDLLEQAKRGELDAWADEPRSALALILLLDQVTRTVHRGTPESFAWDARARELTYAALEAGFDAQLRPVERVFVYMPLMHSESVADHDKAVELFAALVKPLPEETTIHTKLSGNLYYEHQHRDIVVRFGRYPHRNAILGRASTAEEVAFLEQPGSSF